MPDAGALALDARALASASGGPWTSEQLTRVVVSNLLGGTAILAIAYGATRASDTQAALVWFNVGLGALGFVGIANARWLLQTRRVFSLGRNAALEQVRTTLAGMRDAPATDAQALAVWSPGTSRYHRRDCAFVRARETRPATGALVTEMMLQPCEVCQP